MEEGEAAGDISGHVCRDAEKEGHGDFSGYKKDYVLGVKLG